MLQTFYLETLALQRFFAYNCCKISEPEFRATIMDKAFQKFLRSGIDLSPVGVERREDNNPYLCTPKGASIFGWAGVDGIHFCFIRGFGGMVFAVSPMNSAPDFVHPLSKDFADFLRLLLACGDVAALEQAWMWDEAQFEDFLRNNPPTQAQQVRLSEVSARLKLTPMEHPWAYLKELQASFDYGKIKYTEDYYDADMNPAAEPTAPEWKVCFDGNSRGHLGKDRAGTEIKLNKQFDCAGHHWIIPAAYSCMRIEIEYRKRWERAGIAVILLLFLSPGQYIFFKNMPDFLFELSLLFTALLFYAAFIKITTRFFSGVANIIIDEEKLVVSYNKKTHVVYLHNCKSILLSKMTFLGEKYFLLYIKQFDGRNVKLTSMPSAATIDQHPLSHVLIYFSQNLKAAKLVEYDKY